jgi:hypothetical protein
MEHLMQRWAELSHRTITTLLALREAAAQLPASSSAEKRNKKQQKWASRLEGVSADSYDAILEALQEVRKKYHLPFSIDKYMTRERHCNDSHVDCRDTTRGRAG